jgi:hypothetical protein
LAGNALYAFLSKQLSLTDSRQETSPANKNRGKIKKAKWLLPFYLHKVKNNF